jgi:NAD(P)-dependent dehydrogenase (short-subunit alcohol dehydrogenase family)
MMSSNELSPQTLFDLAGKVALVTGGSKGLGKAIARTLAQAGADIAITSRNHAEGQASLKEILDGTRAKGVALAVDHSNWSEAGQFAQRVISETGCLDILVNNAGTGFVSPLSDCTDGALESLHSLNLFAPIVLCREFLPFLRKSSAGRVINVSSVLGLIGREYRTAYCSTKGGLIALTSALALEFAPDGITVNAIAPGQFLTPLTLPMWEDQFARKQMTSLIPLRRWGVVDDLSGSILLLASAAGEYITGQTLVIDGGWSIC